MRDLTKLATLAALRAGEAILPLYGERIETSVKLDGSPLTEADERSHRIIIETLSDSGIPVVSEEGESLFPDAGRYWLVDPLDGTKEFLARIDEFTVNIALVEEGYPVLGVVFAPALDELYAGEHGNGAWKERNGETLPCLPCGRANSLRMTVSRFHDHPDLEIFAAENGVRRRIEAGSALKYARLATGEADVFPRLVGCSEWDTAAGQAVLEAVGGSVLDWSSGERLRYGKVRRRNPRLISFRAPYRLADFALQTYERELL